MSFPVEKYKYVMHTTKNGEKQVIALSTYGGRTVKGIATCDKTDEYNEADGKMLAAARCQQKVAEKRLKRAQRKHKEALAQLADAQDFVAKMARYEQDAANELIDSNEHLNKILNTIG
jgi:hypothetical protein